MSFARPTLSSRGTPRNDCETAGRDSPSPSALAKEIASLPKADIKDLRDR